MYSGESGCIGVKVVVFGQKWLYSGRLVIFRKSGCIWERWLYLGKSGFIRAKVVAFVKKLCGILGNLVVFGEKWLYSLKSGCIR